MAFDAVPTPAPPRLPGARPLAVFLVEDSATIRQNLADALEELAPVQVAGSAAEAAAAVDALTADGASFDLVVIDLLLRSGSGIDVLDALRGRDPAPHRVVLSNYATPALRARCLAAGAERVFDKSGDIEALVDYCWALAEAGA